MKFSLLLFLTIIACNQTKTTQEAPQQMRSVTQSLDTCDNPDANINCCFINMPQKLDAVMRISPPGETGEKLILSGKVLKADGKTPYADVILYAYQTDHTGHYTKSGTEQGAQRWHGRLHGWCRTDANGKYEIHTIRPARYPDNSMPAHIHVAVKEPNGAMPFYINDFVFKNDNLVNATYLNTLPLKGETGVVEITNQHGVLRGVRNITLDRTLIK